MFHPNLSLFLFRFRTVFFSVTLFCLFAEARPEYALSQKNNCTACHALPMGAGPRLMTGKIFGSRDFPPAETSMSDLIYADIRAEYFKPNKSASESRNGLALMVAAVSVNAPIKSGPKYELRALGTFDMGALSSGSREQVLIWSKSDKYKNKLVPDHIVFGKYYLPFGLLTDEHRTYTRMQSRTSFRDYDMGANLSWDFLYASHFDLSLTNGFQSAGQPTNEDETSAITGNLRFNPTWPFLLGVSYSQHNSQKKPDPRPSTALSIYGGLDLDKMTFGYLKASLTGEIVTAKGWNNAVTNPSIGAFFSTNATFLDSVKDTESQGIYGLFKWDLTRHFTLVYKYDQLALDKKFTSDAFIRHGYGFNWQFDSNLTLMTRFEDAVVKRKELSTDKTKANEDLVFMMLRMWI